ncbi:MAG: hypothetical protein QM697_17295 [Lachnospiraceae bacterium]
MNTKRIPALIMLIAGAIACIMTYLNHYDLKEMLTTLIWVLLIFLIIGLVVKKILDSFHMPGENAVDNEGEVIEKQEEEPTEEEEEEESEEN